MCAADRQMHRCVPANVHQSPGMNTIQRSEGRTTRARWCKAACSLALMFHSAGLIISCDGWGCASSLYKGLHTAVDRKHPRLLPKCKFAIIMISATICAISAHLSALPCAFTSPHASMGGHTQPLKTPFKAGAVARGGTCIPAKWISCFSGSPLLCNQISLQSSPGFQWSRGQVVRNGKTG